MRERERERERERRDPVLGSCAAIILSAEQTGSRIALHYARTWLPLDLFLILLDVVRAVYNNTDGKELHPYTQGID